jgi:hypothetical protein
MIATYMIGRKEGFAPIVEVLIDVLLFSSISACVVR